MSQTIRLMIVGDNRLFRECLASVLANLKRFTVTDLADSGEDALKKVKEYQPDVMLIDLNLPNKMALELTKQIT